MGDFFSQTREQRGLGRIPQNFSDPGGGPRLCRRACARRCMHTHSPTPGRAGVAFHGGAPSKLALFSPAFCLFPGGLLVVVELAQALVIGRTDKQVPVSTCKGVITGSGVLRSGLSKYQLLGWICSLGRRPPSSLPSSPATHAGDVCSVCIQGIQATRFSLPTFYHVFP